MQNSKNIQNLYPPTLKRSEDCTFNEKSHIWAIADLHLSISCPEKNMENFGDPWANYIERIKENWLTHIGKNDLVLLPGDITWATNLELAKIDLTFLATLPGIKVMIEGNHDYWWRSISQVRKILPKNFYALQNDALNLPGVSIAGSRLWDTNEYNFSELVDFRENPKANLNLVRLTEEENERIYIKELHRLELSLSKMDKEAKLKIAMTHYPPIGNDLKDSRVHKLLLKYDVDICVFGHIHSLHSHLPPLFGVKDGISYQLSAADYLQFIPLKLR